MQVCSSVKFLVLSHRLPNSSMSWPSNNFNGLLVDSYKQTEVQFLQCFSFPFARYQEVSSPCRVHQAMRLCLK